jgi:hypothetical protein
MPHHCPECFNACACPDGELEGWAACTHDEDQQCVGAPCLHPAPLPHTVTPSADAQHCYGVCRSCGVSRAWPSTEECRDA